MDERIENKRIYSLDFLKSIMAFMVCLIHWSDSTDYYYLIPTRIAVPVFIAISGFFWPQNREKQFHQIKKILLLLLSSQLFYFLFYAALKLVNKSLLNWLLEVFSIRSILDCLIFNRAKLGGHLWYLFAVLYTMVIVMVLQRIKMEKALFFLSIAGILVLIVAGKYSILFFGKDVPTYYTKSFFCVGIPFFTLGMCLKSERMQKWIDGLSNIIIVVGIALFLALGFVEKTVLRLYSIEGTRDFYISTIVLTVFIMIFAIKNKTLGRSLPIVGTIGEKDSAMIYIIHIAIISIVSKISSAFAITDLIYKKIGFVLIFVLSLVTAIVWRKLIRLFVNRRIIKNNSQKEK